MSVNLEDEIDETASDLGGLFYMSKFVGAHWPRLLLSIGLIASATACVMLSAKYLGQLVASIPTGVSWSIVMIFLALELFHIVLFYAGRLGMEKVAIRITLRVRQKMFGHLAQLPMDYFDQQPMGRTLTRLTSDVEGLETFFSGSLSRLCVALINFVAVFIAVVLTDLSFGLQVILSAAPALIASVLIRLKVRYWLRIYKKRGARVNARLAEFINGNLVIRAFGIARWSQAEFVKLCASQLRGGLKVMHWNTLASPLTVFLCSMPLAFVLWRGGHMVYEGSMALAAWVAFVRYGERFVLPIRMVAQEIQHIQEALVSSERIRQMLCELGEEQVLGEVSRPNSHKAPLTGSVSFENVVLSYRGGPRVLEDVSFQIEAGETVALVGATGSGKTSTVHLIPYLYPLTSGSIQIDGIDIRHWSRGHLRRQIGYVGQEVVLFRGTIRQNLLATAGDGVSDARIWEASERTGLTPVIERLGGLEHLIVDRGDNLSTGERQLMAFTRMLICNPKIVIMDEATANVDERTEEYIQVALQEVMKGRTCFVVAHRLSTIENCDRILVFEKGRLVEQGAHETLAGQRGVYQKLISRQTAFRLRGDTTT